MHVQCHLRLLLKSTTLLVTKVVDLEDLSKTKAFNAKNKGTRIIKAFLRHQDMNLFLQRSCIEVPALSVPINANELSHKVYFAQVAVGDSFFCERERALTEELPRNFGSFLVISNTSRSTGLHSPRRGAIRRNSAEMRNSGYKNPCGLRNGYPDTSRKSYASSFRDVSANRRYIDDDHSSLSAYERPSSHQSASSIHPRRLYINEDQEVMGEKTGKAVYKLVPDRSEPGVQAIFYPPEDKNANSHSGSGSLHSRNSYGRGSKADNQHEYSQNSRESRNNDDTGHRDYQYGTNGQDSMSVKGTNNNSQTQLSARNYKNALLDSAPLSFDDLFYILKDPGRINLISEVHFDYDRGLENGKGICERCSEHPAILYCLAERASLCAYCDESIHFDEYTKRHAIYYYDTSNKKSFLLCEEHPQNVADLFCEECMLVLCAQCKVDGSHSKKPYDSHQLIKFANACDSLKEKLLKQEKSIEDIYDRVSGQIGDVLKEEEVYSRMVSAVRNKIETEYRCALKDLQSIIEKKYGVLNAIVVEKRIAIERCARIQIYTKEIDDGQKVRDYQAIMEQKDCLKDTGTSEFNKGKDDIVLKGFLSVFTKDDGENMNAKKEEYADISRKLAK